MEGLTDEEDFFIEIEPKLYSIGTIIFFEETSLLWNLGV
jgi:hypothetical protein